MTTPLQHAGLMAERRIKTLERQLDAAKSQARILLKMITELEARPHLQRVTPEAMAELEARLTVGIMVLAPNAHYMALHNMRGWQRLDVRGYASMKIDRPAEGWFIDLSTIPEVT